MLSPGWGRHRTTGIDAFGVAWWGRNQYDRHAAEFILSKRYVKDRIKKFFLKWGVQSLCQIRIWPPFLRGSSSRRMPGPTRIGRTKPCWQSTLI